MINYNIIIILICYILGILLIFKKEYYNNLIQNNPRYIFWTGGFDSTYCILEAIFIDNNIVIPIYLSGIIDNTPSNSVRRKNNKEELMSIKNILNILKKNDPEKSKLLKPLIIIPNFNLSTKTKDSLQILYNKKMVRRPICQYGYLSQISLNLNKPIEIAIEKEPRSSIMYKSIHRFVTDSGKNRRIHKKYINKYKELDIYRNFRFTTLHLSKQNMLQIAKLNNFDKYLYLTWSCWYPKNGKPCGRCIMCKERII